ncbi:suppressor of cytokine signaling 6 [Lasius niger]|uniref:Suppressor of cytokine signaling 6 n=1 Tax=Lasius niger TaxID=67767 RepID=A0A0J7NYH9_LASNI|nr:suppressor of cytokine signaling 6 [Lasius niger]
MINPNADSESVVSTAAERVNARQKSKHGTSGRFATFIWRRENNLRQECKRNDSANDTKDMEHRLKNPSGSKVSFDFFRNIKKHLQIKNLCKSKHKSKETDVLSPSSNQNNIISVIEPFNSCQERELSNSEQEISSIRQPLHESRLGDVLENSCHSTEENIDNINTQCYGATGMNLIVPTRQQDELTHDIATVYSTPSCSDAIMAVPSSAIAKVPRSMNETLSNEHKVRANLAKELLNLSKYGWYWGPISGDEADTKLISEPDGAFLVRDSSDDRILD